MQGPFPPRMLPAFLPHLPRTLNVVDREKSCVTYVPGITCVVSPTCSGVAGCSTSECLFGRQAIFSRRHIKVSNQRSKNWTNLLDFQMKWHLISQTNIQQHTRPMIFSRRKEGRNSRNSQTPERQGEGGDLVFERPKNPSPRLQQGGGLMALPINRHDTSLQN